MYRIAKQGRLALAHYIRDVVEGRAIKAINTLRFSNYIAMQTGYKLEVVNTPNLKALRGILLRKSSDSALILISDGENNSFCWQRFTLVKEVCHLFLQHETNVRSDNALEMAQSLMKHVMVMPDFLPKINGEKEDFSGSQLEASLRDDLKTIMKSEEPKDSIEANFESYLARINPHGAEESSAVVAAIEIMIPPINHDWLREGINEGQGLYQLANDLKVPKVILEHRLNEWGLKTPMI